MSNFKNALRYLLKIEGGFADFENDLGGRTNLGITHETYVLAIRNGLIKPESHDVKDITHSDAEKIYKNYYWDPIKADLLPGSIALVVFDAAVHSGPKRAVETLQQVLGIEADGIIGPQTIDTLADINIGDATNKYIEARRDYLHELSKKTIKGKPQEEFGSGWHKRMNKLQKEANSKTWSIELPTRGNSTNKSS